MERQDQHTLTIRVNSSSKSQPDILGFTLVFSKVTRSQRSQGFQLNIILNYLFPWLNKWVKVIHFFQIRKSFRHWYVTEKKNENKEKNNHHPHDSS